MTYEVLIPYLNNALKYRIVVLISDYEDNKSDFLKFYNMHVPNNDTMIIEGTINFIIKENLESLINKKIPFYLELSDDKKVLYKNNIGAVLHETSKIENEQNTKKRLVNQNYQTAKCECFSALHLLIMKWYFNKLLLFIILSVLMGPFFLFFLTFFSRFNYFPPVFIFIFSLPFLVVIFTLIIKLIKYLSIKSNFENSTIYQELNNQFDLVKINEEIEKAIEFKSEKAILTANYLIITNAKFQIIEMSQVIYMANTYIRLNKTSWPGLNVVKRDGFLLQCTLSSMDQALHIIELVQARHMILCNEPNVNLRHQLNGEIIDKKFVNYCIEYRNRGKLK